MNILIRLLITTLIVISLSYFIKGVTISGIQSALIVSVVIGFLNTFLKPILVFFTFPITLFTLGLFLLVINAAMVMLCDYFVEGFKIDSFITALLFSIILSISQWILYKIFTDKK